MDTYWVESGNDYRLMQGETTLGSLKTERFYSVHQFIHADLRLYMPPMVRLPDDLTLDEALAVAKVMITTHWSHL